MMNNSGIDLSFRGGRQPDVAIFSHKSGDCFALAGLVPTGLTRSQWQTPTLCGTHTDLSLRGGRLPDEAIFIRMAIILLCGREIASPLQGSQ